MRRLASALAVGSCVTMVLAPAVVPPASGGPRHVSAVATTPVASCTLRTLVSQWGLRRLAEQTVVVPVPETDVASVTGEVADGAGGVILFGSTAPADLGRQLARLASAAPAGNPPVVMTDEEGGTVQRMANLVGWMPSARRMAKTMSPDEIRHLARQVGGRMLDVGVTMNLAPVLDLDDRPGPDATNPDGTRSFGMDVTRTTHDGLAFATGMRRAGVVPVVKHFPGLGYATANPDYAAADTQPWSRVRTSGLLPFRAAIRSGLPAVMVTTARVPGLTRLPATLSRAAIRRALRHRLGFHGLVLTDSLSSYAVQAAGFTVPRASVRALSAGADMVLFDAGPSTVADLTRRTVSAIVSAARHGTLSRARLQHAVLHVLRAKHSRLCG